MDFFLDQFAAFRLEAELNSFAINGDVRFQQRCRAARAAQPRILLASRTKGAAPNEFDHGGKSKFTRRRGTVQMLTDAALNARQRVRQTSEPARFTRLTHQLPLWMIAILQASSRIAADRLDMRIWIDGV